MAPAFMHAACPHGQALASRLLVGGLPLAGTGGDWQGTHMTADLTDAALALAIAEQAGRLLMDLRADGPRDPAALGAAGDMRCNRLLLDALAQARPGDAILSEESPDSAARLSARRLWIIDPLDGTREYAAGRDDFAVHVALLADGRLVAGAVAQPARGRAVATDAPPALPAEASPLRITISRSRPPALAQRLADAIGAALIPMGSAGAKTLAVLHGEADAYLHQGDMNEWDSAAPAAVAQAAGLSVTRLDGSPLAFNQPQPRTPDILICHPQRRDGLLAAIAKVA
jgi:3'(2'), 5'-bisphosphate nucleotidase